MMPLIVNIDVFLQLIHSMTLRASDLVRNVTGRSGQFPVVRPWNGTFVRRAYGTMPRYRCGSADE